MQKKKEKGFSYMSFRPLWANTKILGFLKALLIVDATLTILYLTPLPLPLTLNGSGYTMVQGSDYTMVHGSESRKAMEKNISVYI